ncbi:MAG: hypothetical protein EOM06_02105 [Sphingobacteriia bacterium]|nr:hypothetical protein [Sphingobacteriia bacterium]
MKTKSVLLIIATLVIGFIIGFLTNGQITRNRIDKFVKTGTHEGFKGMYFRILQPDPEQIDQIEPILDKYGALIHDKVNTMQKSMKELHQQMVMEINPYLSDEQRERLTESIKRFERDERMRRNRRPMPMHNKSKRPPFGHPEEPME